MSAFGGLILTNKGRNLQAKAQTGVQLNFTRISVGDGDLAGTSILDLNALKHEVESLAITKLKTMTGGKAVVGTVFSNETILAGFYWRELGVFAQDPDLGEILYCYGNAGVNAEYIPAGGGPDIIEKSIDVVTIVGNAANVTAIIESSLVYTTAQELNDAVDEINIVLATKETPAGAQAKATAAQEAAIAYAVASIAALVNSSPAALDTLNELAAALGNDPNFATTITNVLALKAPLASPALTGTPTAPTPAVSTNTTQLATTAFVKAVVAALVDSSPAALDTLNELAAALGDDPNFAATITGLIGDIQTALAVHKAEDATLTTKGHVQLSNSTTSTSEVLGATSSAIKAVKDAIPVLNNTVTSTSTTQAGTANAVKIAYDKANSALQSGFKKIVNYTLSSSVKDFTVSGIPSGYRYYFITMSLMNNLDPSTGINYLSSVNGVENTTYITAWSPGNSSTIARTHLYTTGRTSIKSTFSVLGTGTSLINNSYTGTGSLSSLRFRIVSTGEYYFIAGSFVEIYGVGEA